MNSLYPSAEESWEEMAKMEPRNNCETPEVGGLPSGGFGVAMLPVGALCFYQAHLGRTVLPKWPFWTHLFYSVFYSVFRV